MTVPRGDPTPDIESGRGRFGTQVRDLRSVLRTYKGTVAILKLKENPFSKGAFETDSEYQKRMSDLRKKCTQFKNDHRSTWYQLNFIRFLFSISIIRFRLLSSALPFLRFVRVFFPFSKYWKMCSDIVASFYKHIGVLPEEVNTEDVIPEDFISDADGV